MKKKTLIIRIIMLITLIINIFFTVGIYKLEAKTHSADASIEKEVLVEKSIIRKYMKSFVLDSLKYSSHKKNKQEIYTLFLIEEKNKKNEIKIECFNESDVLVDTRIEQENHSFSMLTGESYFKLYKIETNNYVLKRINIYSFNKIKRININGVSFEEYNQKFIDSFIQEINDKEIEIEYKKPIIGSKFFEIILLICMFFLVIIILTPTNDKKYFFKKC